MKVLTLLLLLTVTYTTGAQTFKKDSTNKAPCKCYLAKDPNPPANPYAFADSVKGKRIAVKKKKTR